jgi:hypothetical protein
LERADLWEEMNWRQKSRMLWFREGEKCTKFFHRVANSNRRNNSIESLLVNGSITSYRTQIREYIVHFYNRLFTKEFSWWLKLDGLAFDFIYEEEAT